MINILFSRVCILTCGTLYPGYMSFKSVRAKIINDYVKWLMYWIVFAIFKAAESFMDMFLTWFPFYYEFKVFLILWLLPPMGNGSSFIYKNCIHPLLKKHETKVDHHLEQVREKGQDFLLHYMREAVFYLSRGIINVINKNCPNGVLRFLAKNNPYDNDISIQGSSIIITAEEDVVQHVTKKPDSMHRISKKTLTKNLEAEQTHTARARNRKTRQTKPQIDFNLNESK